MPTSYKPFQDPETTATRPWPRPRPRNSCVTRHSPADLHQPVRTPAIETCSFSIISVTHANNIFRKTTTWTASSTTSSVTIVKINLDHKLDLKPKSTWTPSFIRFENWCPAHNRLCHLPNPRPHARQWPCSSKKSSLPQDMPDRHRSSYHQGRLHGPHLCSCH
jgi:hypothetical protein